MLPDSKRAIREEEFRELWPTSAHEDLSNLQDTELDGLIALAGRKHIQEYERENRPMKRTRRR